MTNSLGIAQTARTEIGDTVSVLAIDGSPVGGGRTRAALEAVTGAAAAQGGIVTTISLAEPDGRDRVLYQLGDADAVVLGAPVYRAAAAAPLKELLDAIPRDADQRLSTLAGKAVVIVNTGASWQHFLALDGLRSVLAGFFAAHVVPPGLYVPREAWSADGGLLEPFAAEARAQGEALVELTRALAAGTALRALRSQA